MTKLLTTIAITLFLAYMSQKEILSFRLTEKFKVDIPLIVMMISLTLFCGLRTSYNDTVAYHNFYLQVPTVQDYLNSDYEWTDNPLFQLTQCFFKEYLSEQPYLFFFCASAFSIVTTLWFIKKYSNNFIFGMLLFFATDLLIFNLSAVKQCIAMAILMIAIDQMLKGRYAFFYVLVAIAVFYHTYAIVFIVLPFLCHKPWTIITYAMVAGIAMLMLVFQSFIVGFLSAADEIGKSIYEGEVIGAATMNPIRVLVFAIPTLFSFIFQQSIDKIYDKKHMLLMNMNIIFCLVNCLGILSAANMFGRAATYFAIGMIISLPKMLPEIFDTGTNRMISIVAAVGYIGFFLYDNMGFDAGYRSMTFTRFLELI